MLNNMTSKHTKLILIMQSFLQSKIIICIFSTENSNSCGQENNPKFVE